MKHQAFMDRIKMPDTPYSRSHNRRLKRNARSQLVAKMDDLASALNSMEDPEEFDAEVPGVTVARKREVTKSTPSGLIGEGKGAALTKSERKAVL